MKLALTILVIVIGASLYFLGNDKFKKNEQKLKNLYLKIEETEEIIDGKVPEDYVVPVKKLKDKSLLFLKLSLIGATVAIATPILTLISYFS